MGWQSDDPGRDIRGSGILSLHNLGYMAEHFPETFDRLMHKRTGTRSEWEYPFAAAGVNLTFMLSDMSGLYRPAAPATRKSSAILQLCGDLAQEPVEAHGRLFVAAYNILDDLWLQREASYMDFPAVLSATREALAAVLVEPNAQSLIQELCAR